MKQTILILITMLIALSCKNESDVKSNFKYRWGRNNQISIQDGYILLNDTNQKIQILDSNVVFNVTRFVDKELTKKAIVRDTLIYDFRKIFGTQFLFFYKEIGYSNKENGTPMFYDIVYQLREDNPVNIIETNYLKQPNIKIAGYSIGDSIDRDLLNIDPDPYWETETGKTIYYTESGRLKSDYKVGMGIIGGKYITYITLSWIPQEELDNLVASITYKMGFDPTYFENNVLMKAKTLMKIGDKYSYSYNWLKNGVNIRIIPGSGWGNIVLYYNNYLIKDALFNKYEYIPADSKYIK